jgi:hypothetical protein
VDRFVDDRAVTAAKAVDKPGRTLWAIAVCLAGQGMEEPVVSQFEKFAPGASLRGEMVPPAVFGATGTVK